VEIESKILQRFQKAPIECEHLNELFIDLFVFTFSSLNSTAVVNEVEPSRSLYLCFLSPSFSSFSPSNSLYNNVAFLNTMPLRFFQDFIVTKTIHLFPSRHNSARHYDF
jgi:hypothetical protein